MASNNSGNRTNIPEAKQALNNMKFEIAKELGGAAISTPTVPAAAMTS